MSSSFDTLNRAFGCRTTADSQEREMRLREILHIEDQDPRFAAWQWAVNLLYLQLNQLGLSALQRYCACYLLSRAIGDVYGESAQHVFANILQTKSSSAIFTF